jgi:SAM-dependent methyltransferase
LEGGADLRPTVTLRLEPRGGRSRVELTFSGWRAAFEGGWTEELGWAVASAFAPFVRESGPEARTDWLVDRVARRPSGVLAEADYADPTYHRPHFVVLLDALALVPTDRLLEVGSGGGAFLRQTLPKVREATAVDHSAELLRVVETQNRAEVRSGRLTLVEADAAHLPLPSGRFTAAVLTSVFGLLPDPFGALQEVRRVLGPGGRLAIFTTAEEVRGTPAAPEPIASRIHFYTDVELVDLARKAGFQKVQVARPDLYDAAVRAGLPEEVRRVFRGSRAGQLLTARAPRHVGVQRRRRSAGGPAAP